MKPKGAYCLLLLSIVVDYYSRRIEVAKLPNKSSCLVIDVLREIYSRLGTPKELVADNVPFCSIGSDMGS